MLFSFYELFLCVARYQRQLYADLSPVEIGSSLWHPPSMLKPAYELLGHLPAMIVELAR